MAAWSTNLVAGNQIEDRCRWSNHVVLALDRDIDDLARGAVYRRYRQRVVPDIRTGECLNVRRRVGERVAPNSRYRVECERAVGPCQRERRLKMIVTGIDIVNGQHPP